MTYKERPYTCLLIAGLIVAGVALSVQLPFAYYSADNVFHAAKIMASGDGDFTVDPVTGFTTIYPPLFHIIWGGIMSLLGLSSFQVMRVIQVVDFIGLHLAVWFLARVVLNRWDKAALVAMVTSLMVYGPTGKYVFFQNPYNFSIVFCVLGAAFLLRYSQTASLKWGLLGAVIYGIGVNIWWWHVIPLSGLMLGLAVVYLRSGTLRAALPRLIAIGLCAGVTMVFSVTVFLSVAEILPYYDYDMLAYSYAGQHTTLETIGAWLAGFVLKGNQPFFKHLVPGALDSSSTVVLLYALVASVHYYLLVLPFNALVLFLSVRAGAGDLKSRHSGVKTVLLVAAGFTLAGSIVALYRTDPSVLRRIQFHSWLYLLPVFFAIAYDRLRGRRLIAFERAVAVLGLAVLAFLVVYRFTPDLSNPLPQPTREVVRWIEDRPDHAHERYFTTGYDALILAREVRFQSFVLADYHPMYFRLDKHRGDSVWNAYQSILNRDDSAAFWLREFNTKYAIIGKKSVNISPVVTKITENELSVPMRAWFSERGPLVFDNEYWSIFDLSPNDGP